MREVARIDADVVWRDMTWDAARDAYRSAGWPVTEDDQRLLLGLGDGIVAVVVEGNGREGWKRLASAHGLSDGRGECGRGAGDGIVRLFRVPVGVQVSTAINLHGALEGVHVWSTGRDVPVPPSTVGGFDVRWRSGKAPRLPLDVGRLPEIPAWLAAATLDPIDARRAWDRTSVRPGEGPPCTDLGNAERLAQRHGPDLRWCEDWSTWLVWNGTHWARDRLGEVARRAFDTVRDIAREGAEEGEANRRKELLQHAMKSESAGRLDAMVRLARAQPGLAVLTEALDANPWALPCANGTIDLRSGSLRPSRREDLATRSITVTWDPSASCPRWEQFLEEVQPDPEVRAFLQRWAGYAATGVIREHAFTIHWGSGRNGKSVFMDTLLSVLGEYARQVPTELLVQKHGATHPAERMVLRGLRLASASETEQGARLAVALLKALTGGEAISARGMRENFTEFQASHKLALQTNNKPTIADSSPAVWLRMCLVEWGVTIAPERQDPALKEKLLEEAPGILRWIVEGCLAWQREGLRPPRAVQESTEEYRRESDPVSEFLAARCTTDPLPGKDIARVMFKAFYESFKSWCEDNGRPILSGKVVGATLKATRGVRPSSYGGGMSYVGLRLLEPAELAGDDPPFEAEFPPHDDPPLEHPF